MHDDPALAPQPAESFDEALARFDLIAARDDDGIAPRCRSALLHHREATDRVLVLLHGFTNCPAQWAGVATDAFERGYTVLVPRAEGHGRVDLAPHGLSKLTTFGIARWVVDVTDVAAGLGRHVTLAGFSFGGVCAAWGARHADAVDDVVLIAPSFLPFGYPLWTARWLSAATQVLPEAYPWWDPIRRERGPRAPYSYDRLSRRGIGAVFGLGQEAWHGDGGRTSPLHRAVLITNERDVAISSSAAEKAFSEGIAPLATTVVRHKLPFGMGFPHDLIDPEGMNAAKEPAARSLLLDVFDG